MARAIYKPKQFKLSGLKGISDKTLEMHFGLYEGYVKNTNALTEQLAEMSRQKATGKDPAYAELTRRLGFEYGGMILHEYYFENLAPNGKGGVSQEIKKPIDNSFGEFETWKSDFVAVGEMRGVGWAILFQDPVTQQLSNHWIVLHHMGVPSGFKPILVMDVWEHAFLLDYKPSERTKYIEAFFANINWDVVQWRLASPGAIRAAA
ncbi:MAG TPA: superoxide dismutase [Candidatus Binatia bacterium]|nr:superoxide dismutase [Candidatus Binatia bacterium]